MSLANDENTAATGARENHSHVPLQAEIAREQQYVDFLFGRLDQEVAQAQEKLRQVQLGIDPAHPEAEVLIQRETEYHLLNEKIDRLNVAGLGLVFGRIDVRVSDPSIADNLVPDMENIDRRYIGRMGLDDRADDYRTLLLDWRAPLARPFYLATTAHPSDVVHRRHIRTTGRVVTGVDDEFFTQHNPHDMGIAGENALFHAMQRARTGHMASIVETIQREQDKIIRDATRGVMVVEGGPGTGKTAVALHRIAYLLYTWRKQLSRTGVLIIGPNQSFLNYISRVLPELGETGVVLSTIGELFPGVTPHSVDSLLAQEVKGSTEMLVILDRTIKTYQTIPHSPRSILIDGIALEINSEIIKTARTRARRGRRPHNQSQSLFKESLLSQLAEQMVQRIGADPLGGNNLLSDADLAHIHDELAEEKAIDQIVEEFWPLLDPETVLARLFESKKLIETVAYDYDVETQTALWRENGTQWTHSDTALLDELAVLIGLATPEQEREQEQRRWEENIADAQEALDILASSANSDLDDETEAEVLSAFDVIDAKELARRQQQQDYRTTAQRAKADYSWAYGHVIIDEAQELTPMEWRMIMRRCPAKWMTVVGDTSQTSAPAGVDSWAQTLEPFVKKRFKIHELSVNYRTPAEIMDLAYAVLQVINPDAKKPLSMRQADMATPIRFLAAHTDPHEVVQQLQEQDESRLCAIIVPDSDDISQENTYSVSDIKGLEFDHVVVVNPQEIVEQSPQGWQNLYVALTRATQSLVIIGDFPIKFPVAS
ncbi:helicase [Corynebacterium sp. sy017]|uniref:HelD family protein n=1 Tax=unclassified Corynebacterium TaxID=2624378 RepID=UPI001184F9ED|nr:MULTISPECIES: AAA family ATPase [unclassified Corynebacterium]MBP3089174.1 helicase [Corynebacterium sp. sy017]TSD91484.1 helicase [Corynebacterium sp. SY003]